MSCLHLWCIGRRVNMTARLREFRGVKGMTGRRLRILRALVDWLVWSLEMLVLFNNTLKVMRRLHMLEAFGRGPGIMIEPRDLSRFHWKIFGPDGMRWMLLRLDWVWPRLNINWIATSIAVCLFVLLITLFIIIVFERHL
ncbi:putative transmembrane protein [Rhizoctonia solani 123E]|uniref:Putative transmembrane protein n=1 Tax=Rhizoctonia solani 123E TaxID=1423351 RepID=A0A074SDW2_9AGAM|nr:putative transmembrane protein [Rhizoctonia solani 123E]